MVKGVRRGCVRLQGAVIGIDDEVSWKALCFLSSEQAWKYLTLRNLVQGLIRPDFGKFFLSLKSSSSEGMSFLNVYFNRKRRQWTRDHHTIAKISYSKEGYKLKHEYVCFLAFSSKWSHQRLFFSSGRLHLHHHGGREDVPLPGPGRGRARVLDPGSGRHCPEAQDGQKKARQVQCLPWVSSISTILSNSCWDRVLFCDVPWTSLERLSSIMRQLNCGPG